VSHHAELLAGSGRKKESANRDLGFNNKPVAAAFIYEWAKKGSAQLVKTSSSGERA
jgi:hypothetical protein